MSLITTCSDAFGTSRQAGRKPDMRKHWLVAVLLVSISFQIHAQNGWTLKAPLRSGRVGATASVVGGKIYVIGATGAGYVDLDTNDVYDPLTNQWATRAPMPTPRAWPFSGVVNDTIYVLGGGYPTATTKVEAYVPATDSWDTTKAPLVLARIAANAAVIDGIIYHAGGSFNRSESQAYHTSPNFCQLRTSIPAPQKGALSATAYNGLIYTFGGSNYSPWSPLSKVNAYNPQTDQWDTTLAAMRTPRFALQTYLVEGKIYAIGGSQSEGTAVATVEVYDPATNTWTTIAPMPRALAFFAGAVVNNKIYVIGGTANWVTGSSELWEFDPSVVGVEQDTEIPKRVVLLQNYPNPFNPNTTIKYELPRASHVTLRIYNTLGQEVAILVNEVKQPGTYTVQWDASGVAGGIYLYKLQAGSFVDVKKCVLVK